MQPHEDCTLKPDIPLFEEYLRKRVSGMPNQSKADRAHSRPASMASTCAQSIQFIIILYEISHQPRTHKATTRFNKYYSHKRFYYICFKQKSTQSI